MCSRIHVYVYDGLSRYGASLFSQMDYRDLPTTHDVSAITCVEMIEAVPNNSLIALRTHIPTSHQFVIYSILLLLFVVATIVSADHLDISDIHLY